MRIRCRAFTLVEIILAILIISAIITVLLYFYQRSVEVRQTVLHEAEYLSVSRMLMEQITGELRTARNAENPFRGLEGDSNLITFVCTTIPPSSRWIVNTNEPVSLPPLSDLKRVTYRLLAGTNASEVLGLDRVEELLTGGMVLGETNLTESSTNTVAADLELIATNQLTRPPLTPLIKHLHFRYWAGTNWVESWSARELPAGVEITLGRDPIEEVSPQPELESASADEWRPEVFRRVVYLPNSAPGLTAAEAEDGIDPFGAGWTE